ncbi:MAG: Fe-S protein assembly co-chaperone HscB [Rhodocyclaceae bacterium]|nr:Fe-S protein assembly co-chaperone HscB [Rhodocyclaceae bacterium]
MSMAPHVLDEAYRGLQARVHPDRYADKTDAERRVAMQWATAANEAYRTLRKPLLRAKYLIESAGVGLGEQDNTAMPAEFLMQQMEWREHVAEARAHRDDKALRHIEHAIRSAEVELWPLLESRIAEADWPHAADVWRRLRFLEKLHDDIEDVRSALLD